MIPHNKIPIEQFLNKRFGNLIILEETKQKQKRRMVNCICDCGKTKEVRFDHLREGLTTSCGCSQIFKVKEASITHGLSKNHIYKIWNGMKTRCTNSNRAGYKSWGGKGIKVCDEWVSNFQAFYNWSMENGYKKGLTIDRIDNNGNYEPSNCQWLTLSENISKSRKIKITFEDAQTIRVAYSKGLLSQSELAEVYGISQASVWNVIHNRILATKRKV